MKKVTYLAFPRFLFINPLALSGLTLMEFQLTFLDVSERASFLILTVSFLGLFQMPNLGDRPTSQLEVFVSELNRGIFTSSNS